MVLWGERSSQGSGYDVLAVWREHAENVTGHGIDSGHFLPEEAPEETYRALRGFFRWPLNRAVFRRIRRPHRRTLPGRSVRTNDDRLSEKVRGFGRPT
jgi:hypothetical protein